MFAINNVTMTLLCSYAAGKHTKIHIFRTFSIYFTVCIQ